MTATTSRLSQKLADSLVPSTTFTTGPSQEAKKLLPFPPLATIFSKPVVFFEGCHFPFMTAWKNLSLSWKKNHSLGRNVSLRKNP
jgi:hypothetical protein